MKTSVNIPDWLHEQARATSPNLPFGVQVRDALLLALPVWKDAAASSPVRNEIDAQVRLTQALAARAGVKLPKDTAPLRRAHRRAVRREQVPGAPPARPKAAGKPSATKAGLPYIPKSQARRTRAPSRPK